MRRAREKLECLLEQRTVVRIRHCFLITLYHLTNFGSISEIGLGLYQWLLLLLLRQGSCRFDDDPMILAIFSFLTDLEDRFVLTPGT